MGGLRSESASVMGPPELFPPCNNQSEISISKYQPEMSITCDQVPNVCGLRLGPGP